LQQRHSLSAVRSNLLNPDADEDVEVQRLRCRRSGVLSRATAALGGGALASRGAAAGAFFSSLQAAIWYRTWRPAASLAHAGKRLPACEA
jgi:hypothetical protein